MLWIRFTSEKFEILSININGDRVYDSNYRPIFIFLAQSSKFLRF